MDITTQSLKINPLLASLNEKALSQLADHAEVALFGQGMGIAGESSDDNVFLIVDGNAQVQVVLNEPGHPGDKINLGPGEFVAAVRFFEEPFPSDAYIANTDIKALRWRAADLHSICEADPESGYRLAKGLGQLVIRRIRAISSNKNV